jgi:hypothetical protein
VRPPGLPLLQIKSDDFMSGLLAEFVAEFPELEHPLLHARWEPAAEHPAAGVMLPCSLLLLLHDPSVPRCSLLFHPPCCTCWHSKTNMPVQVTALQPQRVAFMHALHCAAGLCCLLRWWQTELWAGLAQPGMRFWHTR